MVEAAAMRVNEITGTDFKYMQSGKQDCKFLSDFKQGVYLSMEPTVN